MKTLVICARCGRSVDKVECKVARESAHRCDYICAECREKQ